MCNLAAANVDGSWRALSKKIWIQGVANDMLTAEQIEALAIRNAQIDAETRSAFLAARRRKAIRDCKNAGGNFEADGDCYFNATEEDVPQPAPRKRRTLPKAPARRRRRTLPKVPMAGHVRKSAAKKGRKFAKKGRKSAKKGRKSTKKGSRSAKKPCRSKKTGRFTKQC